MGKSSKRLKRKLRKQASWSPNPNATDQHADSLLQTGSSSGDSEAKVTLVKDKKKKQKREEVRSLKRKKKSPALLNLLGNFPREVSRTGSFDPGLVNNAEVTDIVATNEPFEGEAAQEASESEAESLYQSRKLMMRQMIIQGLKEKAQESEADSWTEIEEKFAEIYEPIPYNVAMDTWRSMSKEQMLEKVQSSRIRSEMKYMSRTEILNQIEHLKNDQEQNKKKVKNPVVAKKSSAYEELPGKKPQTKERKPAAVPKNNQPDFRHHIYQNGSNVVSHTRNQSLSEIFQAKMSARKPNSESTDYQVPPSQGGKTASNETALYVTKALVHAEAQGFYSESDDQIYQTQVFSRSKVIGNITAEKLAPRTKLVSRSELIERLRKRKDSLCSDIRSIDGGGSIGKRGQAHWSSPSCTSSCDEGCSECDGCSGCSCSSCDSGTTVVSQVRVQRTREDGKALPPAQTSGKQPVDHSAEAGDKESVDRRSGSSTPEPVPLSQVKQRRLELEKRRIMEEQEKRLRELVKRTRDSPGRSSNPSTSAQAEEKNAPQQDERIYQPVSPSRLLRKDAENAREKSKSLAKRRSKLLMQLKHKLKESMEAEGDPKLLEQRQKELKDLLREALDSGTETLSNINLGLIYVPMEEHIKSVRSQLRDTTDYDTFGSIDSLIFEPKLATPEEIREVQEQVANHFEYLNEEYASCSESSLSIGCTDFSRRDSKNEAVAATAAVADNAQVAVAALCEDSVSERLSFREDDSDSESVTSFNSVICQGQKLLDAELARSKGSPQRLSSEQADSSARRFRSASTSEAASELGTASENCTVVDTDASWDYVDGNADMLGSVRLRMDLDENYRLSLEPFVIGNLRKRPMTTEGLFSLETEETAKLLESLRIAEESGASSSLRLLFPTLKQASRKDKLVVTSFAQLASLAQAESAENSAGLDRTLEEKTDSIESLNSFGGPCSSGVIASQETDLAQGELETYYSKNGEPLYGARNSRFLLTEYAMKTSFFETAVILNRGSPEQTADDNLSNQLDSTNEENKQEVSTVTTEEQVVTDTITQADPQGPVSEPSAPAPSDANNKRRGLLPPFGMFRRETMIRELKSKFNNRFRNETGTDPNATTKEPTENPKKEPMITRILGSLSSFGHKKQGMNINKDACPNNNTELMGHLYPERQIREQYPMELLNTCYHVQPPEILDGESSIYDPSFPSDVPPFPYAGSYQSYPVYDPVHAPYPFISLRDYPYGIDPRELIPEDLNDGVYPSEGDWANEYEHEGLYSISQRLDDPVVIQNLHPAPGDMEEPYVEADPRGMRRVHEGPGRSWSDMESLIFAEDRSVQSVYVPTCSREHLFYPSKTGPPHGLHPSRMSTYQDDWLFWDQLQKARAAAVIQDDEERNRRMMLWIHHSQFMHGLGVSNQPPWWQAKQRASVQWLISKAYGHQVPEDLKDAFYRDMEDREHLKASVIHALASAELYCLALAHIYADPNYSHLNHWQVIQALARKGVYVAEPSDVALTETTLIHTSPLRMSAHMAVMEALMSLYVREIVTPDRVVSAVRRFGELCPEDPNLPRDTQEALFLWINKACSALSRRLSKEHKSEGDAVPSFPVVRELGDLSDGICLLGVVAFYCPDVVDWNKVALNEPLSMADCFHNIQLMKRCLAESLPYEVCHLSLEDLVYSHSSIRQNTLAFLADLFFVMEVRPIKSLRSHLTPSEDTAVVSKGTTPLKKTFHRRNTLQPIIRPIPDLRKGTKGSGIRRQTSLQEGDRQKRGNPNEVVPSPSHVSQSTPKRRDPVIFSTPGSQNEDFVVHRGRSVPTLHNVESSVTPSRPRQAKERLNTDTKAEERGEESGAPAFAAGVPSNWEDRKVSYAGRRSRRNSVSDDSHLTIENFGGSQENLSLFGRNPDKEPVVVNMGRRLSTDSGSGGLDANAWKRKNERSQVLDNLGYPSQADNRDLEEQDRRSMTSSPYSSISSSTVKQQPVVIIANPENAAELYDDAKGTVIKATSFAELSKLGNSGINIVYMQPEKESFPSPTKAPGTLQRKISDRRAQAPAWEPQQLDTDEPSDDVDSSEIYNARLKMEETRKRIESEKRKLDLMASKQRERVGKAAFLQAFNKQRGPGTDSPGSEVPSSQDLTPSSDISSRSQPLTTPDSDPSDYGNYPSVAYGNDMGPEIQLRHRQQPINYEHYRTMQPTNGVSTEQYFQHESSPARRTWGQPVAPPQMLAQPYQHPLPPDPYGTLPMRRAQWGAPQPARPFMPNPYMMGAGSPYMDPRNPQGFSMSPARMPVDPYDPYYMNGGHYMDAGDPYYYNQPGHFSMAPQPQPTYQPAPPPSYMSMGQSPAAYPSVTEHRQPFRLHDESSISKSPAPIAIPQSQQQFQQQELRYQQQEQRNQPQDRQYQQQEARNQPQDRQYQQQEARNQSQDRQYQQQEQRRQQPEPEEQPQQQVKQQPKQPPQVIEIPVQKTPAKPLSRSITRERESATASPAAATSTPVQTPSKPKSSTPASAAVLSSGLHSAVPTPSVDDMEPQSVSFIETQDGVVKQQQQDLPRRLRNLKITSGTRTYRIPHETVSSPPRPTIPTSFQFSTAEIPISPEPEEKSEPVPADPDASADVKTEKLKDGIEADKGFIITFDDTPTPKRPKPQLGMKRQNSTPKKPSTAMSDFGSSTPTSSKTETREISPRRSLSSLSKQSEFRDDHSPSFTPESRDSGFGQSSQDDLKTFPSHSVDSERPSQERSVDEPMGLVIGDELLNPDPSALDEMERKKEKILLLSLRRKQQQEEARIRKEQEAQQRKEDDRLKEEEKQRKKEEEKARRAAILEQYKIKKAMEEAEKEGRPFEMPEPVAAKPVPKLRAKPTPAQGRPRPKTIHIDAGTNLDHAGASGTLPSSRAKRGSGTNLSGSRTDMHRADGARGSSSNLLTTRRGSNSSLHGDSLTPNRYARSAERGHSGRKDTSVPRYGRLGSGSVRSSREDLYSPSSRGGFRGSNVSLDDDDYDMYHGSSIVHSGRKGSGILGGVRPNEAGSSGAKTPSRENTMALRRYGSLINFSAAASAGKAPVQRRAPSPALSSSSSSLVRRIQSPTGPGSLPSGLVSKARGFDDGASDISSGTAMEYIGPKLYKQAAPRSNRSIILNAVEYCVFPGVVNREAKQRVLEEITRSDSKNFLVLFRDAGCQFRALYSYCPEREEIIKLYGTGPKQVTDNMLEKFFKYNSGSKRFSPVHTKHLTVTIDAFTIHPSLWQGKKASLPNRKDMTLVI